jgi:integrase
MTGRAAHIVERKGRFYARVVVPADLREAIGKWELRAPLGASRSEAAKKSHAVLADFHRQIEAARAGLVKRADERRVAPPRLDILTFDQIAHLHYRERLEFDDELRNSDHRHAAGFVDEQLIDALKRAVIGTATDGDLRATVGTVMTRFALRGHHVEEFGTTGWRTLARTVAQAELEALRRVSERDEGDFTGRTEVAALAGDITSVRSSGKAVTFSSLLDGYLAELAASGKGKEAERRWRPVFKHLAEHLGHEDATRVTAEDIVAWKEKLLASHAPKTIKDVYLAALKTVVKWGVTNRKIATNIAADVTIRVPKQIVTREKGFNDDEAVAVLKAASEHQPRPSSNPRTREGAKLSAAKKWVPWLCALTGARVSEMTQLRKQDVQERGGIAYVRITSDAGSVKTGEFRDVPLHPQLVERGFLQFVEAAEDGPLFYNANPTSTANQHPAKTVSGRLSEWVRGLGVIGDTVDPNHGWRHRFKTVALECGVDARVADAIQGHAARTAGEDYGNVTLKTKAAALSRLPNYIV